MKNNIILFTFFTLLLSSFAYAKDDSDLQAIEELVPHETMLENFAHEENTENTLEILAKSSKQGNDVAQILLNKICENVDEPTPYCDEPINGTLVLPPHHSGKALDNMQGIVQINSEEQIINMLKLLDEVWTEIQSNK